MKDFQDELDNDIHTSGSVDAMETEGVDKALVIGANIIFMQFAKIFRNQEKITDMKKDFKK